MSSRSLSPPRRRKRGSDADRPAEPSMTPSSKTGRRASSMPVHPASPAHVSPDRPPSTTPPPYASVGVAHPGRRTNTPPHPQQQSGSRSESELGSPPRYTIIHKPEEEPGSPTSPYGSPPSTYFKPAVLPKGSIFGSVIEKHDSSDGEDDPYFKSLVDKFITAASDLGAYASSEDDIEREADHQRRTDEYAECALKHYNNDETNKVKYELIRAVSSCGIMERRGCYGHVNFIAKGNQQNSKEELFFAEVRGSRIETRVTTCVLSLEGVKKVGGLCETRYDGIFNGTGLPMDYQHCYACHSVLKHPKDGELYETGHVAGSGYYHGMM